MTASMTISVDTTPTREDLERLDHLLHASKEQVLGERCELKKFLVLLRDGDGVMVGGLEAYTFHDWLYVERLFLEEDLRNRGYGSELLRLAEQEAVSRACRGVYLTTYSFQAPRFYERHGYQIFGVLNDFPVGHSRYFMCKLFQ